MPFWAAAAATAAKETFSTLSLEKERERKGTRRVATVQININHCVIIFCCQLNLSKVFIIHKCKTTFDKSFRPRSAPDKVRDRDRERLDQDRGELLIYHAFVCANFCLAQTQIHTSASPFRSLEQLGNSVWFLISLFVLFTFGLFCFICISCDFCRFLWDFLKDFTLNAFYFGFLSILMYFIY